jgi:hypothetical protein
MLHCADAPAVTSEGHEIACGELEVPMVRLKLFVTPSAFAVRMIHPARDEVLV